MSDTRQTEVARIEGNRRPVRVLLFDHTAELGGGEIALAELVRRFDRSRVDPVVLLGSHGPLEGLLEGQGAGAPDAAR